MTDDDILDQDSGVSLPSGYTLDFFVSKGFRFLDASEYRNHVMNHNEYTATSSMEWKTDQFDWNFREHIRAADYLRMKHTQFLEGEIKIRTASAADFELVSDLKLNWFVWRKHPLDKFYKVTKEALFLLRNENILLLLDELTDDRILIRKQSGSLKFRFQFSKYNPDNNRVFFELMHLIVSKVKH